MARHSRRQFLMGSLALASVSLLSGCQALPFLAPSPRVPRIGVLWPAASSDPNLAALRQGLQDFGYIEGQTINIDWRYAEGQPDHYAPLAAELASLPLDVIVTNPGTVNAARRATTTIPIVFGPLGDPVTSGIVQSLAHPGANVTGLSLISPQLAGKRLEFLKEAFPALRSVAAIWNPRQETSMAIEAEEARVAADRLGIRFTSLQATSDLEIPAAFQAATAAQVDGLLIVFSPLFRAARQQVVELAAATRLPTIAGDREFAAAGVLMAYGPNVADLWRHTASYVDKILKGTNPADLPIEQPKTFDLIINLRTAQTLGLTVPQFVLEQATEVIQ